MMSTRSFCHTHTHEHVVPRSIPIVGPPAFPPSTSCSVIALSLSLCSFERSASFRTYLPSGRDLPPSHISLIPSSSSFLLFSSLRPPSSPLFALRTAPVSFHVSVQSTDECAQSIESYSPRLIARASPMTRQRCPADIAAPLRLMAVRPALRLQLRA